MKFLSFFKSKKLLLTALILIVLITVFLLLRPKPASTDTFDEEGNRYTESGDIYYAEEYFEDSNLEPENYL